MKRPLLKLYIVLVVSLIAAIVLLPNVIGKTSSLAVFATTKASLISYNSAEEIEPLPESKAYAVIVMDDGWETQYTKGYEIMSRYGMKGCISAVPTLVDMEGYMSFEQLASVYIDGWDILNHTYNHECLVGLSEADQALQMTAAREWLVDHSFERGADIVVFPNGLFSNDTINVLDKNGFSAGRSIKSVWDTTAGSQREDIEICNLISDSTMKEVKAAVDKAIATGNICIIMLHKIEPVTMDDYMQIDEQLFEEVIEYLYKNREDISVVTMSQLFN